MGLTGRLLLLGLLALVPAFAIQAYDEYTLRRDREAEVHQSALEQATLASFDVDRIFTGVQNLLTAVSRAPSVIRFDSANCTRYLGSLQPRVPHLVSVAIFDSGGNVRCRQDPAPPGLNVSDRRYFQEAMKGVGFVIGDYTISRVDRRAVLPLAVPLHDNTGQIIGVVVAALSLEWLSDQLAQRGLQEGASVTIADRNGVILARQPLPERFVGTRIPDAFMHLVSAPKPGTVELTSQDGTRRILGYVPVTSPPYHIYLSAGIPSQQAFASVNRATRRGIVLLGVGLVLAMGTSLAAGRIFIKRPVDRLLLAAEAWRHGDFSVRTGLKAQGGEISRIGEVFDGVAAELQQRSEALRDSEARLRALADTLPNGMVYEMIAHPGGQRRFVYLSAGVERLFGVTAADARANPAALYSRIHPDDVPLMAAAEEDALRTGDQFAAEVRMVEPDGSVWWCQFASAARKLADGSLVWDGVALDVTGRKQAEQALRAINETLESRVAERTAELAAANRQLVAQIEEREAMEATLRQMQRLEAVGQLTSGVAHDFNNLLTVILGNLELIEKAGLEPRLARRLAMMRSAAERGANLTRQLLAFSRRQRLEPRQLDLNETVANMTDLLQSTMGGSVRLETRFQPDLWKAYADPTQIELVILNLAINARDAMQVGGCLTVETRNVQITRSASRPEEPGPGDYVSISIRDTGTGMSAEVLAKAFEPFFTTKELGRGSGLGLAQVYGFAKQSGGGVRIETELGRGTAIQVLLPRAKASQAAVQPRPAEPPLRQPVAPGEAGQVLLVDDDSAVREVAARVLHDLGYRVIEAGSGGAALDVLADGAAVDLLVVDFAMPGMNGAEVAREARARRPGLPILFVTGYADLAALKGVDGEHVIQKPYRADDLARKIHAVVASP